jgi:UDP-N-acetylglucosamine:LPS N-acetylglucosamine transferase
MVFQLRDASDQLLSHWTRSSRQSEHFFQQTEEFLEDLKSTCISEREYRQLTQLLQQKEADLVFRYLELQLRLRTSEDRDQQHIAIELEKKLENYLKNGDDPHLKREVALRTMEAAVCNWLCSLGLEAPPLAQQLDEGNFGSQIRRNLGLAKKEQGFKLVQSDALMLEELLEKSDSSLEYWNRICASFEQLIIWEETLEEILKGIQTHPVSHTLDPENLEIQLSYFETEIGPFHKQLGKLLHENILAPFSEVFRAATLGKFRVKFQEINNAYGALKNALLKEPVDIHLCCSCQFGEEVGPCWDEKTRLMDLTQITPFYAHKKGSQHSLLIFTCGGGKSHLSVTKAMSEYAKGRYHIQVANTLEDTLASTDVFKRMLLNFSQERLYNHLVRNEEFEWVKLLTSVGPFFLMMQQESIEKQIRLEVLRHHPDLIISCFPCLNTMFLNVARDLNLPILMVTTELDTTFFTKGMNNRSCDLSYPKWRMTLAYDTPEMRSNIEKRIPSDKISITGFPVRSSFNRLSLDAEKSALRREFGIGADDRVLLVIIGGIAGRATEKYAGILASLNALDIAELTSGDLHVICLCGDQKVADNREMRFRINALPTNQRLHMHAIGAIDDPAKLMSISDGLITQPEGCTTNEALTIGLPMIFHAPFALMEWEVFNMEFCIQAKMGSRFKPQSNSAVKDKERLLPLIKEAFERRAQKPDLTFEKKDFGKEFLKLVEELIG